MIKKLFFLGLLVCPAWPAVAQDDVFEVKRPDPIGQEPTETTPADPVELWTRNPTSTQRSTSSAGPTACENADEVLLLDQDPKTGAVNVSFMDKLAEKKGVVTIPVEDGNGYNLVLGFLKNVDRDYRLSWDRYAQYMEKRSKRFLGGQAVELKYTVLSTLPVKGGSLEFGFKPWYAPYEDKAYPKHDLFFRFRPTKGKQTVERVMWNDQMRHIDKFFRAALKYQLFLKKK